MSKNVTLGVPRMKELIDARRKQKAVYTDVYLKPEVAASRDACKRLRQQLKACDLAACVADASVHHDPPRTEPAPDSAFTDRFLREFVAAEDDHPLLYEFVIHFRLDMAFLHRRGLTSEHICRRIDSALGNPEAYLLLATEGGSIRLRMKRAAGKEDSKVPKSLQKSLTHRLMRHLLSSVAVCGIPSASDVSSHKTTTGEWYLQTTGAGVMQALSQLDDTDWYRSHSTDVFEVFETLGIEAAACLLWREMRSVISFDGGYVDARHIFMITNVMTLRGGIMGLNRHGLNKLATSALVRATFEETSDIFFDAAAFSEKSRIASVSDSIIFGQRVPGGTGLVQPILTPEYKEQCALGDQARRRAKKAQVVSRKRSRLVSSRFIPEAELPDDSPYNPASPGPYNPAASPGPYNPSSPPYNPASPGPYNPSSPPYNPASPGPYNPSSPPYNPASPGPYNPSSPPYNPASPGPSREKKSPVGTSARKRKQKAWGIEEASNTPSEPQTVFVPSSPFIHPRNAWAPSSPVLGRRSGLALPTVKQSMERIIPSIMSTERLTSRVVDERPLRDAVYDAKTGVINLERLRRFLDSEHNN
jgi:DNA-directed RNA polymerase II subunit RPB1